MTPFPQIKYIWNRKFSFGARFIVHNILDSDFMVLSYIVVLLGLSKNLKTYNVQECGSHFYAEPLLRIVGLLHLSTTYVAFPASSLSR